MTPAPLTIYVVEDEALIALELGDRLAALGYTVCGQAARGEQALVEIPARRPDLVLMDIKLAGELSGIETAARLRSRLDVPVVFISAFSDSRLVDEAVRTSSFGYLVKPFEERELHATIQAARYKHQIELLLREDKERLEAIVQERTAALLESEAQLRDIFDGTSDLVVSTDAAGRLLLVNRAWRETLGYSAAEVAGMDFLEAVAPAERAACGALLGRLLAGEEVGVLETSLRRKNGASIVVEGRLSARIVRGRSEGARGIFRDVTARKAAETEVHALNQRLEQLVADRTAALTESEGRFRALFERSPILMGLFTLPEGRIVELNDAALAAFGHARREVIGRTTVELNLWADPAARQRFLDELRTRGQVTLYETELRRKNGECFPVLYTASVIELGGAAFGLATIQDITLRKQAERALASAHHRVTVLAQLGRELAEAITPRSATLSILEGARQLLGWDCCWLRLWNEETQAFENPVNFDLVDGQRREVPGNPAALTDISPIVRRTMREGPQLHLRSSEAEAGESAHPFGQPRRSLSLLFAPIRREGRLLGIVSIQSYARDAYDGAALDLLVSLADHCAGALARLQARAALGASEERFQFANRATFDVIWDQDLATGAVWWNEHFERLFGHSAAVASANGDFWRSCLHPDDRERVVARVVTVLGSSADTWSDHYRFRRQDGSYAFVEDRAHIVRDAAGRPIRMLGAMQDRTEQMAAQEALRESEARFRTAFDASPIPILMSGLPDGQIIEVNSAALTSFAFTREEVLGRSTAELGVWARAEQREEFFRTLAGARTVHGFEAIMRTKTGAEHIMLCTGTVLMLGNRPCVLTSAVDITAARQAEADKARLHERLFQHQKFEALGTLAGGVAHDFNNILTAVINFTALAREDCPPTHAHIREYLDHVLASGQRAKELTRQILLFSRAEEGRQEPLLPQLVLKEAITLLRSTLPATAAISTDIDPRTPAVLANATQFHQVVMNLGVNAAHALQERPGCITVRLSKVVLDAATAAALPDLQPGPHVVLEVADTGCGMTETVRARIFEPFFTTKGTGVGTGLGLAVVHSIVRSHRGAITVTTAPGQGSTFSVYLPAQPVVAVTVPNLGPEAPARGAGEHILFVDDEAAVATSAGRLLERLGYRVTILRDPTQALARFVTRPGEFDALITDMQMPGMTGLDLARRVLATRPEFPVIVTSGYTGNVTPAQLEQTGVAALVDKPFVFEELAHSLARALRRAPPR